MRRANRRRRRIARNWVRTRRAIGAGCGVVGSFIAQERETSR
jgi:hypothetical protein